MFVLGAGKKGNNGFFIDSPTGILMDNIRPSGTSSHNTLFLN